MAKTPKASSGSTSLIRWSKWFTPSPMKRNQEWHERMTGYAEKLLENLKLPYQRVLMCTGDMGAGQRKKYDLETWFPAQDKYRETHSASYFNSFQSRRLNIRYQAQEGTIKYVYTLNNTMAASPRLWRRLLKTTNAKTAASKCRRFCRSTWEESH